MPIRTIRRHGASLALAPAHATVDTRLNAAQNAVMPPILKACKPSRRGSTPSRPNQTQAASQLRHKMAGLYAARSSARPQLRRKRLGDLDCAPKIKVIKVIKVINTVKNHRAVAKAPGFRLRSSHAKCKCACLAPSGFNPYRKNQSQNQRQRHYGMPRAAYLFTGGFRWSPPYLLAARRGLSGLKKDRFAHVHPLQIITSPSFAKRFTGVVGESAKVTPGHTTQRASAARLALRENRRSFPARNKCAGTAILAFWLACHAFCPRQPTPVPGLFCERTTDW